MMVLMGLLAFFMRVWGRKPVVRGSSFYLRPRLALWWSEKPEVLPGTIKDCGLRDDAA